MLFSVLVSTAALAIAAPTMAPSNSTTDPLPEGFSFATPHKLTSSYHGLGVQIYNCESSAWKLHSVSAALFGKGDKFRQSHIQVSFTVNSKLQPVFTQTDDHSSFTADSANPVKKVPAANPSRDVPDLVLMRAKDTSSDFDGIFSTADHVVRLNTYGGQPPNSACQPAQVLKVDYSADYYFYSPSL
ncbi:hypothetical protein HDV03_004442 [Kappamyces sp. JEL0829]|nr:hypothetical protein HDV03_004442 [Kappamyces sp. JEL0829]KAJ3356201.1 hypothetical protein HDU91_005575 [Kappamyces sp. JEL0680]